jgi:CRISPR system Cascade subunit CasD
MSATAFLLLRLEGPMHGWGDTARDGRRPAADVPGLSAITGLFANALGWRYEDARRTDALQDALLFAVARSTPGFAATLEDFQTAALSKSDRGWARRGPEGRLGDSAGATTILRKEYRVQTTFTAAVGLREVAPVGLDELEQALRRPARVLFLGRRSCPPSVPILAGRVEAGSAVEAVRTLVPEASTIWHNVNAPGEVITTDRRMFAVDRFRADDGSWRRLRSSGLDDA